MNTSINGMPKFYTLTQVAELLGMHHKTVLSYVYQGKLKASRIGGGKYRVSEDDLQDFLNAQTQQ